MAAPRSGDDPGPTGTVPTSPAVQDYLKVIWTAREWATEPVTTTLLASRLGLSPSTVSEQVRRLADRGLVRHAPYRPVELTEAGTREALKVVRRHRLLETFLVAELGYGWEEVHAEAEVLEHTVSDLLLERIDAKLGHPRRDPHGDPIPTAGGHVEPVAGRVLAECATGDRVVVVRVNDRDPDVLRWCDGVGLRPGAAVRVTRSGGGREPVLVRLGPAGDVVAVPAAAAAALHVGPPDGSEEGSSGS